MYKLLHNGEVIFTGDTEFKCLYKLQQIQPFSYHYATTWGGYKIIEA